MIRLLISVAALAVATSAEAMSPAPLHEPDATQVRKARWVTWPRSKCWAACLMPALSPQPSTSVLHGGMAFALSTMGRSRGGEEGEVAVTPDAIVALVRTLAGALHGQYGEAVQIAAIEAARELTADYVRETYEPASSGSPARRSAFTYLSRCSSAL